MGFKRPAVQIRPPRLTRCHIFGGRGFGALLGDSKPHLYILGYFLSAIKSQCSQSGTSVMDDAVLTCQCLSDSESTFLQHITPALPVLADVSRADVLLFCSPGPDSARVLAHAEPHSVPSTHRESLLGQEVGPETHPLVFRALRLGQSSRRSQGVTVEGTPVVQEVFPIVYHGQTISVLSIEKTLIEFERHRRRSELFRQALRCFQEMTCRGHVKGAGKLTPFGEHDGIILVDPEGYVQYASGVASNLYRKRGHVGTLFRKHVAELGTSHEALVRSAIAGGECLEEEVQEDAFIWVQKALPLYGYAPLQTGWRRRLRRRWREPALVGVMLTIHDATEARRKEQELHLKSVMLQEIQHRVRNSLQTITALLRLEARRASSQEARQVLQESISRILSVAAVHEFLFKPGGQVVNLRVLSERILNQTAEGVIDRDQHIRLNVSGSDAYLPVEQATPCALVINELLLNAVEHGFPRHADGAINVNLEEDESEITVTIHDNGRGLPEDFDLEQSSRLGLHIVQTLVEEGLHGRFEIRNDHGVSATVRFPKADHAWRPLGVQAQEGSEP